VAPRTHRSAVRWARVTVAATALALLLAATAVPGAGSTVSGRVTGAAIPADGAGAAFVRAVDLGTGRIVRTDDADRSGRYRMTVPAGAVALLPTIVRFGRVVTPAPTRVRLRRGQRRTVRLPARPTAVTQRPVVAMPDDAFRGGTGEIAVLNRGLRDMLITDLFDVRIPGCQITQVDRSARFAAAYAVELALTRRGLVDPTTAIRPGRLITPTRGVRGTLTVVGDRLRIDAEVYRWASKRTLHRTSVEGAVADFFTLEPVLARRIGALLCEAPPPVSGSFTGSLDYSRVTPAGVLIGTLDWSGTLDLEPQDALGGLPPGAVPPGLGFTTRLYRVRSGSYTARIRVVPAAGGCTISGQGTFDVLATSGGVPSVTAMSVTEGDPDTYRLALDGTLAQIPTVLSACPPGQEPTNGRTGVWPLLGIGLLPFTQTPPIAAEGVYAGSATGTSPGLDDGYSWTWSLRG